MLQAMKKTFRPIKRWLKEKKKTEGKHHFEDRRKGEKALVLVIAGYKPYLYQNVFSRIKAFVPGGVDVCVVSSGLYDKRLSEIAANNGWSYLSLKRNCVTLAQNIAILYHPKAEYIYKLDEDIFVTKNTFGMLKQTYQRVRDEGLYDIGFVAPLIPINGYGHLRILDKLGMIEFYEKRFERVKYASYPTRMVEKDPRVARFFWGEGGYIPSIDELSERFGNETFSYRPCPIRFSIGCILFSRKTWQDMGMWNVPLRGSGMGADEAQICSYAIVQSQAIIVSENTVVGHLSFGQQNESMKVFYQNHPEIFSLGK